MKPHKYFNRDISWLSFNYRLLEEANDKTLPLYERLKFLAIYSSNLDEFYKVRVAEYKYNTDQDELEGLSGVTSGKVVHVINKTVNRQLHEFERILRDEVLKGLNDEGLILYQGELPVHPEHRNFIRDYFYEKVSPHLQPVLLTKGARFLLRDNQIYLAIRMYRKKKKNNNESKKKNKRRARYAVVQIPADELPRFVRLPDIDNKFHYLFLDDVVRSNLRELFPGYDIESCYNINMLRDADLGIADEYSGNLVEKVRRNLGLRKSGEPALFLFDREIPADFLNVLKGAFGLYKEDMLASNPYLNIQDFADLPNPFAPRLQLNHHPPVHPAELERFGSMFAAIREHDRLLHYPYHSFDYVLRFLNEASIDPKVDEIKVTQYRVATNSAVVNTLINAARNGKKVTVFVEVKARFDEENNLNLGRLMENAGVRIIYSIPGLKVHAKMALIIRKTGEHRKISFAYLSTGNFNEKTARTYADHGFFTCNKELITDLEQLFNYLEDQTVTPSFNKILVTQFNLKHEVVKRIDREIEIARNGGKGYILLKMNGIQNKILINKLYEASKAGVKIDMIIRSICTLVPNQPFSRNIRLIRIVDSFLEHARIWVFGNERKELYLTSTDWLNRNLNRRIETAFPIENDELRKEILDILDLQLQDNTKARIINERLENIRPSVSDARCVRAQWDTFKMIAAKEGITINDK
ncbi:MAG: polyphosphate kinase 1 [Cytophagaceae bacterium]|jgi:polyphosphate kinase|nr:polyphosphate kinase 1 [Cytophagaceae bacterium]